MTKNGIIGLSAGAIIVLGGLSLYTNNAFSSQVKETLNTYQSKNIQVVVLNDSQEMLGGSATYKITLSDDATQALGMKSMPRNSDEVSFFINHKYSSYPLYVASDLTVDFSKGAPKQLMEKFTVEAIEHIAHINTNLLSQSQSSSLTVEPTDLEDKSGVTMKLGAIMMNAITDLEFAKGDVDLNLTKMDIEIPNKGSFSLASLASQASIDNIEGMILAKTSNLSLDTIKFVSDAQQIDVSMNGFVVTSSYDDLQAPSLAGHSKLAVKSFKFSNALSQYDVVDTTMDMTINNLDKSGLIALDKASKDGSDPQAIMNAAQLILARGIDGSITDLSTSVNDVKINSHGKFDWPSYKGDNLSSDLSMHFVKLFNFEYSANLSKNYADVFPQYAPMVDMMVANGFAKADAEGNLSTLVTKSESAIMANGKQIR